MARMSNKLTGRDFSACSSVSNSSLQHAVDHSSLISGDTREVDHALSVKLQVEKLISQATSHENLCQNYVGYDLLTTVTVLFFEQTSKFHYTHILMSNLCSCFQLMDICECVCV